MKVKIMTVETEDKVCHCYFDLRGQQRGKFIYVQKTMNAKEYTKNPESQFSLTQLKMSLFLESKKERPEDVGNDAEEEAKMAFLCSLKKYEAPTLNIYRPDKERLFQK